MKKVIYLIFLLPFLVVSQNSTEYTVFETADLVPNPAQINQFEKGLAAHNKKYHSEEPYGVRVYWVANGPNTGSYHWSMGPFPWSTLDNGPSEKEDHDADWNTNVAQYLTAQSGQESYWRSHTELSRFPKDFTINKMVVDYWDIKRGKYDDAMELVKKVQDVYAQKSPDEIYGIYTNEFPSTKEGKDLAVISFFDQSAYLGQDHSIAGKYDEVNGKGSWDQFLKDWMDVTNGGSTEIWLFRPDLSGISGDVKAIDRQ